MAGINIDANLDGRNFIKSVDNMADALQDLEDEVKQVQKDGDKSLEKLETSFAEVAKASRDAGDDVQKNFRGNFKQAEKHGTDAAEEIKDEFKSNLSEVTSSFDGSVESMGDLVQGTLGGLVSSLGPLGLAAGAAGALGVGLLITEITKAAEEAEASKARIRDMGLAIIDAGADIAGMENVNEQLRLIVTNADEAPKKLEDIEKLIQQYPQLAGDVGKLAMAYAGNSDAIEDVTKQLELAVEAEKEKNYTTAEGARQSEKRVNGYEAEIEKLKGIQAETTAAQEIEANWLASGGAEIVAKANAISTINSAYDETVNSVTDFVNAETGVLDVDAYLAAIDARTAKLNEYQASIAASKLTTEQKSALDAMGIDAAAAWMKGYETASPENKKKMEKSLTEAAKESSGSAKKELDKAFATPTEAKVQAKLDEESKQEVQRSLNKIAAEATLKIKVVDRNGRPVG